MKLIEVSGKVAAALSGDGEMTALIGSRYFPVVAKEGVKGYPYLTYRNLGVTSNEDKDTFDDLTGQIEIEVYARDYAGAVTTSEVVKRVLEHLGDSEISFRMTNYSEEYAPETDSFVNVLTFDYDEE